MHHTTPADLKAVGIKEGFRSGLEDQVSAQLKRHGIDAGYETLKVRYVVPEKSHTYTPDFALPNGVIIETKGRFVTADRQKHVLIKKQRPDLDIRFVFSNPMARISKASKTTYASWCEKHGFQYAAKFIPEEWMK